MIICNIKFLFCWSKPVFHVLIALHYPCQQQLRITVKFCSTENTFPDSIKQNGFNISCILGIQTHSLYKIVMLRQVIIPCSNYFLYQHSIYTVKMLHHLVINLVGYIPLIHHHNVLHPIISI